MKKKFLIFPLVFFSLATQTLTARTENHRRRSLEGRDWSHIEFSLLDEPISHYEATSATITKMAVLIGLAANAVWSALLTAGHIETYQKNKTLTKSLLLHCAVPIAIPIIAYLIANQYAESKIKPTIFYKAFKKVVLNLQAYRDKIPPDCYEMLKKVNDSYTGTISELYMRKAARELLPIIWRKIQKRYPEKRLFNNGSILASLGVVTLLSVATAALATGAKIFISKKMEEEEGGGKPGGDPPRGNPPRGDPPAGDPPSGDMPNTDEDDGNGDEGDGGHDEDDESSESEEESESESDSESSSDSEEFSSDEEEEGGGESERTFEVSPELLRKEFLVGLTEEEEHAQQQRETESIFDDLIEGSKGEWKRESASESSSDSEEFSYEEEEEDGAESEGGDAFEVPNAEQLNKEFFSDPTREEELERERHETESMSIAERRRQAQQQRREKSQPSMDLDAAMAGMGLPTWDD